MSFRYLRDFAFDIVKIDGQFTKNVAADAENQVMIQSLRSISDHFCMFTIAEAVECERDSQWLSETLVDCQLGYFFWGGERQRSTQIGIKDIPRKRLRQHSTFTLLPRCSKFDMSLIVRHAP